MRSEEIVGARCSAYKVAFNTLVNVRGMFIVYYIQILNHNNQLLNIMYIGFHI